MPFDLLSAHGIAALPNSVAAILTIGVPVLLALGFGHLMFALFTPLEFTANAFVGSVKYSFVVEVYAVVAALTLVGSWEIYQTARDTLQKEVGAVYMLALTVDAYNLPQQQDTRTEMRAAIRGYAASVVSDDWPAMQAGAPVALGSERAFQRLARAFLDADPATASQQAVAQNAVQWVANVSDARIARLSVMSRTLSGLIWFLVLTVSVAVIAFQWFFGGGSQGMHYAMGAVIAIIVGAVLLVALKLAFPFVGDPALLSPRAYYELMQVS
ncbi:DUF4239 domain-containing protein [Humitalea sp. 24SJ18S-53]|uniref:bestrophin-like domain n=1 Tax=Humitalea sp. 24SJ18S-53 TaxID=3422307 RepID=UPI003D67B5A0